jgi:hypothetical protein
MSERPVQAIALADAANGRRRSHHAFRDDKSNHPCCTLCLTPAMQSKQQMREHEGGRRHQDNYQEYLQIIRDEDEKRQRLARLTALRNFSNGHSDAATSNPFWVHDLRKVKAAAYDWILEEDSPNDELLLFTLFRAAWKKHVDHVRMDVLLLGIFKHLGSVHAAWKDVAPLILQFMGESASYTDIVYASTWGRPAILISEHL